MTQLLTKDDLRGCPFCGGLCEIEEIESGCFGVGCPDCDFQLMNGSIGLGWHKSESDAVRAWNERSSDLCIQGLQDWTKKLQSSLDAATQHIAELEQGKCLHQIAGPAARFCPECGHVGDVGAGHRDCCPDGSSAFTVPAKWANELRAGFKAQLAAAPQAVQAAVPDGWKLVPVEPTREMLDAYVAADGRFHSGRTDWAVMLNAAPAHPAEGVPVTVTTGERDSFEAWFKDARKSELEMPNGPPLYDEMRLQWEGWHARAALAATQPAAQAVPVLYVSKGQLDSHRDPDGVDTDGAGRYLPARKTPKGNFTAPLYEHPAPAAQGMDAQALKSYFREYLSVSEHIVAGGHAMDSIASDLTNIVLAEQEVLNVLERRERCNTSGQSGEDAAQIRAATLAAQAKQGGE